MDKRSSPRYAISLNALVHPSVGRSWLCQIQDFCSGGMLLVEQNGRPRRSLPGINQGETVGIHFSVPTDKKEQHFRLEGKIVRVMDTGVGINFSAGMDEEALECLSDHSGLKPAKPPPSQAPEKTDAPVAAGKRASGSNASATDKEKRPSPFLTGGLKPGDAQKVVAILRKEAAEIVPQMAAAVFAYMDSELLELAKDAKSNAEQSEYFAAMSVLEKSKKNVSKEFADEILNQFDEPRDLQTLLDARKRANEERKAQSAKKVKLSLVNTDDFEDWLAVANIISRSERMYEKFQAELLQRMGLIVDSWGHSEANPLGTAVFTHAFDEAIQKVDVSKEIRQKVYVGYEMNILPLFRKLYISSTKLMEESGVFPELDEDYIAPTGVDSRKQEEPVEEVADEPEEIEEEEALEPEIEEEEIEELEEDFEPERPRRSSRRRAGDAPSSRRRGSSRRAPSRPEPRAPEPEPRRRSDDVSDAIRSIYSSVRNLVGAKGGESEDDYYNSDEDYDYFEADEVQDLLSTLEDEMLNTGGGRTRLPVRQRLLETAGLVGGRRVAPETLQNLEVVENLVDTIEDDAMLTGNAKDWIRQLELTLDKVATGGDDFLSEKNPHRSMEVINQLAKLGGAETGSAKRAVDEIVTDINSNYDEDPEVFDRALTRLEPLVERQNRAFTGNVQRTVKASQGQQTLINAQRAVVDEMDQRYAGKEIPEVLYKLLMPGWRNLLVNTHL